MDDKKTTTTTSTTPASSAPASWRFAPLDDEVPSSPNARKLGGIVFDVDGTLSEPQNHMFVEMRAALGIPPGTDILAHVAGLSAAGGERARAMETVCAMERRAADGQVPQPGLAALMAHLDRRRVPKALCTRNFEAPVRSLLAKFLPGTRFEPVVTRDFAGVVAPKPHPAGILHVASAWGLVREKERGGEEEEEEEEEGIGGMTGEGKRKGSSNQEGGGEERVGRVSVGDGVGGTERARQPSDRPTEGAGAAGDQGVMMHDKVVPDASSLIVVGDSIDDMTAGREAGAKTVLLVNKDNRHLAQHDHTDMVITRLDDLIDILDNGLL